MHLQKRNPDYHDALAEMFARDLELVGTQPGNMFSRMEALGWTADQLLELAGDFTDKWTPSWDEAIGLDNHRPPVHEMEVMLGLQVM